MVARLLSSFMIVFFANATGTELPYSLLAIVLLSNTLLSIGAPGVPNSAIASFAALAAIAGLPTGIMGMYVSVNILVDAGATCCNVLGDIASAIAMKKHAGFQKGISDQTEMQKTCCIGYFSRSLCMLLVRFAYTPQG